MIDPADIPPRSKPATEFLIREHYRAMGCHLWSAARFHRLAQALRSTDAELGARIGLDRATLQRRLTANQFTFTEGILLAFHDRFARAELTGHDDDQELFPPFTP